MKGGKSIFKKNDQRDLAFENHKHELLQHFWCKYYNHKGHLKEFCWQARKMFPRNLPLFIRTRTKPKPNARSFSFKDKVRVLIFESIKITMSLRFCVLVMVLELDN